MASSKILQPVFKSATGGSLRRASSRAPVESLAPGAIGAKAADSGYVRIKLGSLTVQAKAMGIAAGRMALPKMIQGSMGLGDAFLVRNSKNRLAPEVLVINPAALDQELRRLRPARTLGEIVDVLPFGRRGVPNLSLRDLPDAGLGKRLRLPVADSRIDRLHEATGVGGSAEAEEG